MNNLTFSDLIEKTMLIGITYYTADKVMIERKHFSIKSFKQTQKYMCSVAERRNDVHSTRSICDFCCRARGIQITHNRQVINDPDFFKYVEFLQAGRFRYAFILSKKPTSYKTCRFFIYSLTARNV